jgi:hypothetical protein
LAYHAAFGMGQTMTTEDKGPVDIHEARKRRAEILQEYGGDPFDGIVDSFEAAWRAVWADVCRRKGETIPFEEWFYATDENGDCPFEIAGVGISRGKK